MDQATLMDKIKTGTTLCKAIMRNGYDAYAINAPLQGLIFEKTGVFDVDIACACDTEPSSKFSPTPSPTLKKALWPCFRKTASPCVSIVRMLRTPPIRK